MTAAIKLKKDWPDDFFISDTRSFQDITDGFEQLLKTLVSRENCFSVSRFFGNATGLMGSREKLKGSFEILNDRIDFQGAYLFHLEGVPFYTGISKGVLKRIQQHVKGTSHFTSSLCYKMGVHHYEEINGIPYEGTRKGFNFNDYAETFKSILMNKAKVSIVPIESALELYLFEPFVAIETKTHFYNNFQTH